MTQENHAKYKEELLALRARIRESVLAAGESMSGDVRAPGDDSKIPNHPADFDSEGFDRDLEIARNEADLLDQVEAALVRIEDGTYGRCLECDRPIDESRLAAMPHAGLCVECARERSGERS